VTADDSKVETVAEETENAGDKMDRERKEQENAIVPKFSSAFKAGLAALDASHDMIIEEAPVRDEEDDEDEEECVVPSIHVF
jgi:hypothetical protein